MRKFSHYLIPAILLAAWFGSGVASLAQEAAFSPPPAGDLSSQASRPSLSPETIQQIQQNLPPGVVQQLQKVKEANRATEQNTTATTAPAPSAKGAEDAPSPTPKGADAKPSLLEQIFRHNYASDLAGDLSQFGYNLFSSGKLTPSSLAVPNDNYVLGPGDTMQIRIWGASIDAEYTGVISREGYINIPRVGIVPMAGIKFGQAEKVIRKEAEKYAQGINISVSLARLRSVEVYVVGEVPEPGLQLVPAFSSILEGLLSSGGVNKTGSLRTIQLFRNNKLYKTIDLYDLLLAGSRSSDVLLEDRDVIFVPPIGRTAAVAGAIAKAAIFELKDEKSLADLLALSGGLLPQGFSGRIYLRRFENNNQFSIRDLTDSLTGNRLQELPLQGGDLLEVNFLGSQRPQVIKLIGNVWREDVFTSRPDLKLTDILTGPELLKPEAIVDFALLYRYNPETTLYEARKIPLQRILKKDFDLPLLPYDIVQVLSRQEYESDKPIKLEIDGRVWRPEFVKLTGHVWFPDIFSFTSGLKLSDVLTGSELLQPGAITDFALLHRYSSANARYTTSKIPLAKVFAHEFDEELQPYDRIEILAKANYGISEPVRISGAVWKPGDYEFSPGLTIKDLVAQAGGTRFGANQKRIDISRQKIENEQTKTDHYVLSLGDDFTLQPFDYVFVRSVKDADTFKNVTLNGEVRYPGTYRIQDGEKLSDLIDRAGGFTEYAYFYGAVFTSAQAKIVQQKSIDKLMSDLEIRVETSLSDQGQRSGSSEDAAIIQAQQSALRRLVEQLRKIGASGRMSLRLASPEALRGSIYDFSLDDGDSLLVPKRPNFVSVVGSVYTPNSFLFQPGLTLGDYLTKAGGPTESAAPAYIYVLKANGEVIAKNNDHLLFRSFEKTELMPGDTIVVPENIEKIPYLRLVHDVSDIVFKIAVTAGVVLAL